MNCSLSLYSEGKSEEENKKRLLLCFLWKRTHVQILAKSSECGSVWHESGPVVQAKIVNIISPFVAVHLSAVQFA